MEFSSGEQLEKFSSVLKLPTPTLKHPSLFWSSEQSLTNVLALVWLSPELRRHTDPFYWEITQVFKDGKATGSFLPTGNFVHCIGNAFICAVLHDGSQNANFPQLTFFQAVKRKTSELLRQLGQQSRADEAWRKALRCLSSIEIKVMQNT